jgi:hypothetical protein
MTKTKNIATVPGIFWSTVLIENGVASTIPIDKRKIKEQSLEFIAGQSIRLGFVQGNL